MAKPVWGFPTQTVSGLGYTHFSPSQNLFQRNSPAIFKKINFCSRQYVFCHAPIRSEPEIPRPAVDSWFQCVQQVNLVRWNANHYQM